jgi:hypothetical protein
MNSKTNRYHRYRFPPEIISHAVWLNHRFCLSFRDVGLIVSHETVSSQVCIFHNASEHSASIHFQLYIFSIDILPSDILAVTRVGAVLRQARRG